MVACQKQLLRCGLPITSVSLKPMDFGRNIVFNGKRGRLTMFRQILEGLINIKSKIVFFCEHDVLYHPSHFDITPNERGFHYNENRWRVDFDTGKALFFLCPSVSGLFAYRDLLLEYYADRVMRVERDGYNHRENYEPGLHTGYEACLSDYPNIDIRHKDCLTKSRWNRDEFIDKSTCRGWKLGDDIPGWGRTKDLIERM